MSGRLASFTMSFPGVERRKEAATEETFSHHVLPAANTLGYPFQVLARTKTELNFDMIQEVKSVAVKHIEAFAGCHNKIVKLFLVNFRCCPWTAPFQSASR
jgi:hypothetical protein